MGSIKHLFRHIQHNDTQHYSAKTLRITTLDTEYCYAQQIVYSESFKLNVYMLNVIGLSAISLRVMAPFKKGLTDI